MMNEHAYFHWDLLRQPLQTPQFGMGGMGAPFFDVNSILELRKEKSRDAARSRRGKENYEFYELAKMLPLPAAITSQLDKASIIRLTISYLKLRDFSAHGDPPWTSEAGGKLGKPGKVPTSRLEMIDPFESRQGTHILQSLDGFAFILASDGRFLYISETVSIYLGLSQVEMAGSSIFDYVHSHDHNELAEHLGMCQVPGPSHSPTGSGSDDGSNPATSRPGSPSDRGYIMFQDQNITKSFPLRMKSTLTKRGVHVKTSGYRVVHILGTLRPHSSRPAGCANVSNCGTQGTTQSSSSELPQLGMVGLAIALPPPTVTELRLELDTFITRLNPDFKITYCEPIITDLMDLKVEDVTDRLLYDLCHVADLQQLRQAHKDILSKGQVLTDYYRIMNRHGGYVWVQTCATTLLNNKSPEDQSILAINYVVSTIEGKSSCLDLWQLTGDTASSMSSTSNSKCREEKLKELKASKSVVKKSSSQTTPNSKAVLKEQPSSGNQDNDTYSDMTASKLSQSSEQEDSPSDKSSPDPNKNKRRKMENPRKRKRSNSDPIDFSNQSDSALNLTRSNSSERKVEQQGTIQDQMVQKGAAPSLNTETSVTSTAPEDLSMKRHSTVTSERNIIQHSSSLYNLSNQNLTSKKINSKSVGSDNRNNLISSPSGADETLSGSSVQELEAAMNRHLPANASATSSSVTQYDPHGDSTRLAHPVAPMDFLAGEKNGSVISQTRSQWLATPQSSGSDVLTASHFLRTLYSKRESVIKTNSKPQESYVSPVEPPSSLLTPPEPDPNTYKDPPNLYSFDKTPSHQPYEKDSSYETADVLYKDPSGKGQFGISPYRDHLSSAYIDHFSASMYKEHMNSPYKDIIPSFTIPSLMSPAGRKQQSYSSFHPHHPFPFPITPGINDTCSITPPSSNSPDTVNTHIQQQQQQQQQHQPTAHPAQPYDPSSLAGSYSTGADLGSVCNLSQKHLMTSSLPVVQSPSSTTNPASHYYLTGRHQKDQFYPPMNGLDTSKGGYYSVATPTMGQMYMDLNHTATPPGQYDASMRPILPWY